MAEEQAPVLPTAPGRDVFISYASQDKVVAESACKVLESAGLVCWIAPRDVIPGESFAAAIVHAIDGTKVIVLVLSEHSAASQHVLREVERASSKRHPVIAFRIDLAPMPADFEYFLNTSQWLDASAIGVKHALPKLVDAVKIALTQPLAAVHAPPAPTASAKARSRRNGALVASALLVTAAVTYVAVNKFWLLNRAPAVTAEIKAVYTPAAVPERSIAVLPFVDMSEKHDQEYFAEGMAEEIIERLSKVPALHVPARASSFYFKGKSTKLADIARDLNVANVMEGSVRKSGDHLRIGAQLVRIKDGYTVWSQSFDRQLKDVFKIQDEIATAVAAALQITLSGGPLTREQGGTQNLEAYQLYLRALSNVNENTVGTIKTARSQLEQALQLDPTFGLAWYGLSETWVITTEIGEVTPSEGFERARHFAARAIAVSPGLAEPHKVLAYVYRSYDWNWPAASAELQRALALDSGNPAALMLDGQLAQTLGRRDEAERLLRAALVRDPLFSWGLFNLGNAQYVAGRYSEAEATFRRVLAIAPNFVWTRAWLAKTLLAESKPQDALDVLTPTINDDDFALLYSPVILLANARHTEAEAAVQRLVSQQGAVSAFYVAQYYAYANDKDRAMYWLERAYNQKDTGLVDIVGEPLFNNLASDPRFRAFLRKMNLSE